MKTDLYALSCNLLLLTTHIFCADPFSGKDSVYDLEMGQNQQSERMVQVVSPEEFKWLTTCFDNAPTPSTPEVPDRPLGLTAEEYRVFAADVHSPKQHNTIVSTGTVIPYAEFITAPGAQRFYSFTELARQRAVLISGSNRQSVDAAFRQFMEVRSSDQVDKVRTVIERVEREKGVLCATKETERLCDVLVPVELEHCIVRIQPCTHENDFTCSQYQRKVREALKQAAKQARECHEAMVSMPLMSEVITYATNNQDGL